MTEFDKIYLVWRKGAGHQRFAVGLIERKSDGRNIFKYLPETKKLVETEGFTPYTEFQNLDLVYNGNVAEIFGQRLTKIDRPDIDTFFKFWEVDPDKAKDKFYLLGKTQGLVATDNFEFLAEYKLRTNTHFLTELASLSKNHLLKASIKPGDILRFELEPENGHDLYAVKVFKDNQFLGYIKKYHSKIFYESDANRLKLEVKALDQNGFIKRVFIKVKNDN